MNQENKQTLLKDNKFRLVVPKKKYESTLCDRATRSRKRKYKTKNYKCKIKKVRHSKQMKEALKLWIKVEHTNSILFRSFKRLNIVYDRSMNTFNGFMELAIICIIIQNSITKDKIN
jgi:IS5 family transposase